MLNAVARQLLNTIRAKYRLRPVTLVTESSRPRGRALLSYLADPLRVPLSAPDLPGHPNKNLARALCRVFLKEGYTVDAIDFHNLRFQPRQAYDIVLDIHHNLHRLAGSKWNERSHKLLLVTGNPPSFSNLAEKQRVARFNRVYGAQYRPQRQADDVPFDRSLHLADIILGLGTEGCLHHFPEDVAAKVRWLPGIPALYSKVLDVLPDPAVSRPAFMWLNGGGAIHKGADLAVEAFAGIPGVDLHMVGGCLDEERFGEGIWAVLRGTPNVYLYGHLDLRSFTFASIAAKCAFSLQTSCSEAHPTSTVSLMHMGMVPVATPNCCFLFPPGVGEILNHDADVDEIRTRCKALSEIPSSELADRRQMVQAYARSHLTVEAMSEAFTRIVRDLKPR